MILEMSDKILMVHRRLFEQDHQRYFAGEVHAYDAGVAKVTGLSFVRDDMSGSVLSKPEPRTKLISLASGSMIIYLLPKETNLQSLQFSGEGGHLFLTDGGTLKMDLTEIPHQGTI